MTTSVLLADDSEVVRKVISDLLKRDPEIELVGECGTVAQTMQLAATPHPQVMVLDVYMGDEPAVTPAQLKCGLNGARFLAISVWKDDEAKALAEGAAVELLDKTKLPTELIPAIRQTATNSAKQ
jgi:two-component system, NarL family, response regulator DevR